MSRTRRWIVLLLVLAVLIGSGCNLDVVSSDNPDSDENRPTADTSVDCSSVIQSGWIVYTVNRGDTLFDLAKLYGSTVDDLVAANCLENASRIVVGDTIYLPGPSVTGVDALAAYLYMPNEIDAEGRLLVCGEPVLETIPRPATGTNITDIQAMLEFVTRSYIRTWLNPLYSQNLTVNSVRLDGDRLTIRLSGDLQLVGPCFDEQLEGQLLLTAFHFPEVNEAQIFVGGQNIKPLFDPGAEADAVYTRADVP